MAEMKVAKRCKHCQNKCKLTLRGGKGTLECCPEFEARGNHRFPTWYREFEIPAPPKKEVKGNA